MTNSPEPRRPRRAPKGTGVGRPRRDDVVISFFTINHRHDVVYPRDLAEKYVDYWKDHMNDPNGLFTFFEGDNQVTIRVSTVTAIQIKDKEERKREMG